MEQRQTRQDVSRQDVPGCWAWSALPHGAALLEGAASRVEPVGCPSEQDFSHPKAHPRMEGGRRWEARGMSSIWLERKTRQGRGWTKLSTWPHGALSSALGKDRSATWFLSWKFLYPLWTTAT